MDSIEQDNWLSLDKPFDGVTSYLLNLKNKHRLFIVTARQLEQKVLKQIESFGWSNIFSEVFVTGQKVEKFDLINNSIKLSVDDWFIGDTGKDIQVGKLLGIRTAAVLSGFLGEPTLLEYKPDLVIQNVTDLII